MRRFFTLLLLICCTSIAYTQEPVRVIVIGAHPDDCESDAGGTAALFAEMGHKVKFVSVTNGDAGHHEMGGGVLAKVRYEESMEAAERLGIDEYVVLPNHDGELEPTLEVRLQIIREIRKWGADLVLAPRPNDYHPDHRYTGILVQDAAYMVGVPNVASDTPPLKGNPVFMYTADGFERPNPFRADVTVDISKVYDKKIDGLDAHYSQMYEWLPWIGGYLDRVPKDKSKHKEWLRQSRNSWYKITTEQRKSLEKWYGADRAKQATQAESFQICEYGKQPSDEELKDLFPMLGDN